MNKFITKKIAVNQALRAPEDIQMCSVVHKLNRTVNITFLCTSLISSA